MHENYLKIAAKCLRMSKNRCKLSEYVRKCLKITANVKLEKKSLKNGQKSLKMHNNV